MVSVLLTLYFIVQSFQTDAVFHFFSDYFKEETLHEMIGVRVYELKHDKDRDVRDNTTLVNVSKEVLNLAEMVTKFEEQSKYEDSNLERTTSMDTNIGGNAQSLESEPDPFDELDKQDPFGDNPEPIRIPLTDNENLPTLTWALPVPWNTVAALASSSETPSSDSNSDATEQTGEPERLHKGFKYIFGKLDPSESAEQGEKIDQAEEATTDIASDENQGVTDELPATINENNTDTDATPEEDRVETESQK